jgi:hypothetical protein
MMKDHFSPGGRYSASEDGRSSSGCASHCASGGIGQRSLAHDANDDFTLGEWRPRVARRRLAASVTGDQTFRGRIGSRLVPAPPSGRYQVAPSPVPEEGVSGTPRRPGGPTRWRRRSRRCVGPGRDERLVSAQSGWRGVRRWIPPGKCSRRRNARRSACRRRRRARSRRRLLRVGAGGRGCEVCIGGCEIGTARAWLVRSFWRSCLEVGPGRQAS